MKILHVCLASFYIDNYSYQENILPKMHKKQGHDVRILASTETYVNGVTLGYTEPEEFINENGIKVSRIPYVKWLPHFLGKKLRVYPKVEKKLNEFLPDLIFLHDVQFLSIRQIIQYAKKNKVRIIADGHADYGNSAKTLMSKILHKFIYAPVIRKVEPYIEKFYGTLPARVDFMKQMYKLPPGKIDFLPMGVDDERSAEVICENTRADIRRIINVENDDILLITGGKLDSNKESILDVLEIVANLNQSNLKIVFFGSVANQYKARFVHVVKNKNVINVGWLEPKDFYQYIAASDLGIFLGLHSVLWEEAVGLGIPCLFRDIDGAHHIDVNGNCRFINDLRKESITTLLLEIVKTDVLINMKNKAQIAKNNFLYSEIAKKAIK